MLRPPGKLQTDFPLPGVVAPPGLHPYKQSLSIKNGQIMAGQIPLGSIPLLPDSQDSIINHFFYCREPMIK